MTTISVLRSKILDKINSFVCDERIVEILRVDGHVFEQEDYLWDCKESSGLSETKAGSEEYKAKICELVKDITAFHNTFGGYIIFGVSDADRTVVGFDGSIPFDDVVARVRSDLKKRST